MRVFDRQCVKAEFAFNHANGTANGPPKHSNPRSASILMNAVDFDEIGGVSHGRT